MPKNQNGSAGEDDRGLVERITEKTSITIALAVAICGGAWVAGSSTTRLLMRVEANEQQVSAHEDLLQVLSEIARDNKRRLDEMQSD